MKSHRKAPTTLTTLAVLAFAWAALGIGLGIFAESPFAVATDAACEMGDWSAEEVTFLRGSYGYRFFYTKAQAELRAGEGIPVEIELRHTPLGGWTVTRYAAGT
jgi:hypothetical protein